jgi:hypothetical protein
LIDVDFQSFSKEHKMTSSRKQVIAGWILSGLVGIFMAGPSALGKFVDWPDKEAMFAKMGWTIANMKPIGVLEVICAVLFLIPRTSFLGAILLTGYLGGAIATHVRIGDSFAFVVILGILMWVGLALRRPEIWQLAFGKSKPVEVASQDH